MTSARGAERSGRNPFTPPANSRRLPACSRSSAAERLGGTQPTDPKKSARQPFLKWRAKFPFRDPIWANITEGIPMAANAKAASSSGLTVLGLARWRRQRMASCLEPVRPWNDEHCHANK